MSRKLLLASAILGFMAIVSQNAFAQRVPDPDSSLPSPSHYYYENVGQVIDDTGGLRSGIRYYTEQTTPGIWLSNDRVSFTAQNRGDSLVADSSFRIDMQFVCMGSDYYGPCGSIQAYEPSGDYLNFYQPHCGSGITNVGGYAGVKYQNVFNGTDVHFYSNDQGPVTYFVFRPGSDTGNFMLRFKGQDSISALGGFLQLYVGSVGVLFPHATAYQLDPFGNIIPLLWQPLWVDNGNGNVKLIYGPYNTSHELIIKIGAPTRAKVTANDNLEWCTFYGSSGTESAPIIKSFGAGAHHVMGVSGAQFPIVFGSSLSGSPIGGYDCYISLFNSQGKREWATYYGGGGKDLPYTIAQLNEISTDFGDLLIGGSTQSSDLLLGTTSPGYRKTTFGGSIDGFIASFDASFGTLNYATYFGGDQLDIITSLDVDPNGQNIYFCGSTESSKVNTSSANPPFDEISLRSKSSPAYYQNNYKASATRNGLIGRFDILTRSLDWSTFLGGSNETFFNHVLFDSKSGNSGVYAVGATRSNSQLPLVDVSGKGYLQNVVVNTATNEGLITYFNSSLRLDWCTFFGGAGDEELWRCALTNSGELYVSGSTIGSDPSTTNSSAPNTSGLLPVYNSGTSYSQGPGNTSITTGNSHADGLIARFTLGHRLSWCTYYGGEGNEVNTVSADGIRRTCDVVVDATNTVYLAGYGRMKSSSGTSTLTVGNVPPQNVTGRYTQSTNASNGTTNSASLSFDGWIAQFRPNNTLKWATHFGGVTPINAPGDPDAFEMINSISLGSSGGNIDFYMTGISSNDKTPTKGRCPVPGTSYCDESYNYGQDVFIGKFINANNTSIESEANRGSDRIIAVPNPSQGRYSIYYNNSQPGVRQTRVGVYNQLGQLVTQGDFPAIHGQNEYAIDISNLAAGIYILRIEAGDQIDVCRLSKL